VDNGAVITNIDDGDTVMDTTWISVKSNYIIDGEDRLRQVDFMIDDSSIGVDSISFDGWGKLWNTMEYEDLSQHSVWIVAEDTDGKLHISNKTHVFVLGTPPERIKDLIVDTSMAESVLLKWTSPYGDDSGAAISYDIRYSYKALTKRNWDSCILLNSIPVPGSPGTIDSLRITGLPPNTPFFFGIKSSDACNHFSDVSNIVSIRYNGMNCISNLRFVSATRNSITVAFTAPAAISDQTNIIKYDIRYYSEAITPYNWHLADEFINDIYPSPSGESELITITDLNINSTYYIALTYEDENNYQSGLSNIIIASTLDYYSEPVRYGLIDRVGGIAFGKINNDSYQDILLLQVSSNRGAKAIPGNGDGTFGEVIGGAGVGIDITGSTITDVNCDGYTDVAVTYPWKSQYDGLPDSVMVFICNGDGTYQGPNTYPVVCGLKHVRSGYINDDNYPDLVTANYTQAGYAVAVLMNNGLNGYEPAQYLCPDRKAEVVSLGDYNGDGHTDIANVITLWDVSNIVVMYNDGTGSFIDSDTVMHAGLGPTLLSADLDNDGIDDLISTSVYSKNIFIYYGGSEGLSAKNVYIPDNSLEGYGASAVYDVNDDNMLDIVLSREGKIVFYVNEGSGIFTVRNIIETIHSINGIIMDDIDNDGDIDLIHSSLSDYSLQIYYNTLNL